MGRSINTGTLTKAYILSKISQISIFSTYLDIPDTLIQHCINSGDLILSPIRDDNHPTVGFKYDNKGRLKMKDFAGYFWGDCFDIVALITSCIYNKEVNISIKSDFIIILRHITITFKNIFYGSDKDINLIHEINISLDTIKKRKPHIEVVIREWLAYDEEYWNKRGVTLQYLNTHFIYAVDQYYIDRKFNPEPKYYYNTNDPCYVYILGKDKISNIQDIKLYFPNREHGVTRFITNCNHLEGIYNLERKDYDIICITKSTKDRASLECAIMQMKSLYRGVDIKIGVINIPHETYKLRQYEYDWLHNKLSIDGKICSLMDNDRVGKLEAKWLRVFYNIIPIIIKLSYEAKDFDEFRVKYGCKKSIYNIINIIKYIKDYDYENIKLIRHKKEGDISPF